MALQANINRNVKKKKEPFSGNDFNPYAPPPPPAPVLSREVAIAHAEALARSFRS